MRKALCVACKNSEDIDIYCKHYINLGFDKIFIYEDKGSFPLKPIVDKFAPIVEHNYLPELPDNYYDGCNDTCVRQLKLYNWFIEKYKDEFDWIALFDDDEYLQLPENTTLDKFLSFYNKYSSVYLYWDMLRSYSLYDEPNKDITQINYERYYAFAPMRYEMKSIVNTKLVKKLLSVHFSDGYGVDVLFDNIKKINDNYNISILSKKMIYNQYHILNTIIIVRLNPGIKK